MITHGEQKRTMDDIFVRLVFEQRDFISHKKKLRSLTTAGKQTIFLKVRISIFGFGNFTGDE